MLGTTQILSPIGKGGMAQVYLGSQRTLERPVAVKVMLPTIASDREFAIRFRREALSLAQLQHENIVTVYDLVEKNQQLFMIMEYIDGIDVGELLGPGPLPLDVSLAIVEGVVRALEHAHFHRIVHRDVKPSNVMVSTKGRVKLTDFGIAKDLEGEDLTKTGMVVGTPSYLAPEVFRGEKASPRTDLYAVGVLLYRCLSGKSPFGDLTGPPLYRAIAKGERNRLREASPACPRGVERLVDTCLAHNPEHRYRNAAELRAQVSKHLDRALVSTPAARLVTFLYHRGYVTADHLGMLALDELQLADADLDVSLVQEASDPGTRSWKPAPSAEGRPAWGLISLAALAVSGLLFLVGLLAPQVLAEAWSFLRDWFR